MLNSYRYLRISAVLGLAVLVLAAHTAVAHAQDRPVGTVTEGRTITVTLPVPASTPCTGFESSGGSASYVDGGICRAGHFTVTSCRGPWTVHGHSYATTPGVSSSGRRVTMDTDDFPGGPGLVRIGYTLQGSRTLTFSSGGVTTTYPGVPCALSGTVSVEIRPADSSLMAKYGVSADLRANDPETRPRGSCRMVVSFRGDPDRSGPENGFSSTPCMVRSEAENYEIYTGVDVDKLPTCTASTKTGQCVVRG